MRAMFLGLVGLLTACSPAAVLNAVAPRDGVGVTTGLPYGTAARQSLDVYVPGDEHNHTASPRSVIVFLYGGAWRQGERETYRFLGAALARRGYVVVVPDYRLFPAVRYPDFVRDAARAVAWTRQEIAQFGGDPNRIFVMGHSAGAYLALMLTLDRRWLAEVGLDADRDLAGAIGLSGPYDFAPLRSPGLTAIFPDNMLAAHPIRYARAGAPRVLLAHGQDDDVVRPNQSEALAHAIRDQGGQADLRLYSRVGHMAIVGALSAPLRWMAPVLPDVDAFIAATPRGPIVATPRGPISATARDPIPAIARESKPGEPN